MEKRWFAVHIERDSCSGPNTIRVEEWDTKELALASANAVNAQNTEPTVPDYYIMAEISNDLSLTQHKTYVDKRGPFTETVVKLSLKERVDELSKILDQPIAGMDLRSKLLGLHDAVRNETHIPENVFDDVTEEFRRAALLGLIMVTVQSGVVK